MNVLYYCWSDFLETDMIETLTKKGHEVRRVHIPFEDYDNDPKFETQLSAELKRQNYDFVFTFNFFPIISKVAMAAEVPYISWIFDMPHATLDSPHFANSVNHIFVFDSVLWQTLSNRGSQCHVYHMPLPVNTDRLARQLGEPPQNCGSRYDVSFVGQLYEKCLYNQIQYLPDYLNGYLMGIMEAQQKVYGYNMVRELLTPDILEGLGKYVGLEITDGYVTTYRDKFADLLNARITSEERIRLLNQAAGKYAVTLFSDSDGKMVPGAAYGGTVDYVLEMPGVFRTSKINLNITLRSIVSGIPLRGMDIMGAGGFLLSNYQPELCEYFKENEDCVLFESEEDMMNKIEYYLSHEKERNEIAVNGYRKIRDNYSCDILTDKVLSLVFGEQPSV